MTREELAAVLHDGDGPFDCRRKWRECVEFHNAAGAWTHERFYLSLADKVLAAFEVD